MLHIRKHAYVLVDPVLEFALQHPTDDVSIQYRECVASKDVNRIKSIWWPQWRDVIDAGVSDRPDSRFCWTGDAATLCTIHENSIGPSAGAHRLVQNVDEDAASRRWDAPPGLPAHMHLVRSMGFSTPRLSQRYSRPSSVAGGVRRGWVGREKCMQSLLGIPTAV